MLTPEQRDILMQARAMLSMLTDGLDGQHRLHPMTEQHKEVTALIAEIERMLGY